MAKKKSPFLMSIPRPAEPPKGVWIKHSCGSEMHLGGNFRLSVIHDHIFNRGEWSMTFHPVIDLKELTAATEDEAKAEALEITKATLMEPLERLKANDRHQN